MQLPGNKIFLLALWPYYQSHPQSHKISLAHGSDSALNKVADDVKFIAIVLFFPLLVKLVSFCSAVQQCVEAEVYDIPLHAPLLTRIRG